MPGTSDSVHLAEPEPEISGWVPDRQRDIQTLNLESLFDALAQPEVYVGDAAPKPPHRRVSWREWLGTNGLAVTAVGLIAYVVMGSPRVFL